MQLQSWRKFIFFAAYDEKLKVEKVAVLSNPVQAKAAQLHCWLLFNILLRDTATPRELNTKLC